MLVLDLASSIFLHRQDPPQLVCRTSPAVVFVYVDEITVCVEVKSSLSLVMFSLDVYSQYWTLLLVLQHTLRLASLGGVAM